MRLPSNIGVPNRVESISGTSISDPMYTSVIGTMLLIQKYDVNARRSFKINWNPKGLLTSLQNFIKKIIP